MRSQKAVRIICTKGPRSYAEAGVDFREALKLPLVTFGGDSEDMPFPLETSFCLNP